MPERTPQPKKKSRARKRPARTAGAADTVAAAADSTAATADTGTAAADPTLFTVSRFRLSLVREEIEPPLELPANCTRPAEVAAALHQVLADHPFETLGTLLLTSQGRPIGYVLAYNGTLTRTAVEPRGLLIPALLGNAAAILFFHGHPSGTTRATPEDFAFTRRMLAAAQVVGVRVIDHLILGEPPRYLSVRQHWGIQWHQAEMEEMARGRRR